MEDHISSMKEAHKRFFEAVKAVENNEWMVDMIKAKIDYADHCLSQEEKVLELLRVERQLEEQKKLLDEVKHAHDHFLSEEKKASEFIRVKTQQLEEQWAAYEEKYVKSDLAGSDQEMKAMSELDESFQAAIKDAEAFRQFSKEFFLPKCLDLDEPDPKKNT